MAAAGPRTSIIESVTWFSWGHVVSTREDAAAAILRQRLGGATRGGARVTASGRPAAMAAAGAVPLPGGAAGYPTAGVGMGLTACDRGLEITEILPNGPVHRVGKVRIGDILKKVDGRVVGDTVSSAKELLIGPLGSTVTLTVLRHSPFGMPDAISVCVVRGSATIQGLERPESGSFERPSLPASYTPFAGSSSEGRGAGSGCAAALAHGVPGRRMACVRARGCCGRTGCRRGRTGTRGAAATTSEKEPARARLRGARTSARAHARAN
jgi:hypothetical protein